MLVNINIAGKHELDGISTVNVADHRTIDLNRRRKKSEKWRRSKLFKGDTNVKHVGIVPRSRRVYDRFLLPTSKIYEKSIFDDIVCDRIAKLLKRI